MKILVIGAGAVGWVCQYESLDRLLHVIRGVARGEMLLPPGETAAVLRLLARGPDPDRNGGAVGSGFAVHMPTVNLLMMAFRTGSPVAIMSRTASTVVGPKAGMSIVSPSRG